MVKIINKTSGALISENADIGKTFFKRLLGLMFSKPRDLIFISPKENIKASSIHMCFMKFPIDVIWLSSDMEVIDINRGIRPFSLLKPNTWKIYKPKKPAKYIIELGVGNSDVNIGDEIEFR